MIDLESKQKVWAYQLPLFKENYILTSDLDLLEFDMINGQFDIKPNQGNDGFDDEDSLVLYHSVNTAWAMWLIQARAKQAEIDSLKACRSDFEIIQQTIALVDLLATSTNVYQRDPSCLYPFESENPRAKEWWRTACKIQELLTNTDPENCDFDEYKEMIEAAQENSHEDNACTKYDWSNVPNEVNVITTNKFGKKEYWWMWRGALPKLGHSGWYDEYCGRCIDSFSISEFVGDWKESLEVRPKMTLKKSDGDRHE